MGVPEVEAFLTNLAIDRRVASSTQNQAPNALLFLYREVLRKPIAQTIAAVQGRRVWKDKFRNQVDFLAAVAAVRSPVCFMLGWPASASGDPHWGLKRSVTYFIFAQNAIENLASPIFSLFRTPPF